MKRQWLIVAAVLGLLSAGAFAGVKLAPDIFPVEVGAAAPTFHAVDIDRGDSVTLDKYKGQVALVNIWATWCEPCRLEMPSLDAMAARRRGDGVVVAAVNYKEAADVVRRFVELSRFKSQVLLDSDGDATAAWTPRVFPSTVLIGRNGVPAQVVVGELDWEGAEAKGLIDSLVAAPGRA